MNDVCVAGACSFSQNVNEWPRLQLFQYRWFAQHHIQIRHCKIFIKIRSSLRSTRNDSLLALLLSESTWIFSTMINSYFFWPDCIISFATDSARWLSSFSGKVHLSNELSSVLCSASLRCAIFTLEINDVWDKYTRQISHLLLCDCSSYENTASLEPANFRKNKP